MEKDKEKTRKKARFEKSENFTIVIVLVPQPARNVRNKELENIFSLTSKFSDIQSSMAQKPLAEDPIFERLKVNYKYVWFHEVFI